MADWSSPFVAARQTRHRIWKSGSAGKVMTTLRTFSGEGIDLH